jgi:hypothetical protein
MIVGGRKKNRITKLVDWVAIEYEFFGEKNALSDD